jgi:hypothetical protein
MQLLSRLSCAACGNVIETAIPGTDKNALPQYSYLSDFGEHVVFSLNIMLLMSLQVVLQTRSTVEINIMSKNNRQQNR